MAYLEKSIRSLQDGWTIFRRDPLFLYSALSVAAMYVLFTNYPSISDLAEPSLRPYHLMALTVCTIVSLVIGAIISNKLKLRAHLLLNLMGIIFGTILFLPISGLAGLLIYPVLGGLSAGLYIPNIFSLIINSTNFENRGSVSGLFIMVTYVLIIGCSLFIDTLVAIGLFFVLVKLISIALVRKTNLVTKQSFESSFTKFGARIKVTFGAIWLIFLLGDALVFSITSGSISYEYASLNTAAMILGLVSMLLGGVIMDNTGRKNLLVYSLSYLGLEYAMISLSAGYLMILTFLDGFVWGILTVFFFMVLAGDIFSPGERPFYISSALTLALLGSYLSSTLYAMKIEFQIIQIFPLASILLFVAVIIMLFLPETLPDKVRQKKELQDYLQRAKKVKEKYK